MTVGSIIELIEALTQGDFDRVIGTPESAWLDFKQAPYQLTTPTGRWKLAKDVGAFANGTGGVIVIGYRTERQENEGVESAIEARPIEKTLIQPEQYRQVIGSWLYPMPLGIDMRWFPPGAAETKGIFVIQVPGQQTGDFLVKRMTDDSGKETGAIGLPHREGDSIFWVPAETIHHRLRQAGASIQMTSGPASSQADQIAEAAETFERVEISLGFDESPVYGLQAMPPGGTEQLPGFYSSEGVKGAIANPPSLRSAGFNLRTGATPEVEDGALILRRHDRGLRLQPSGRSVGLYVADRNGLGWAINDSKPLGSPLVINSLALIEFTLEFFRFVHQQLMLLTPNADWVFGVHSHRLQSAKVVLRPNLAWKRGFAWDEDVIATKDDFLSTFQGQGAPEADAFVALTRFYGLWGLGEDSIPYSGQGRVLPEEILAA